MPTCMTSIVIMIAVLNIGCIVRLSEGLHCKPYLNLKCNTFLSCDFGLNGWKLDLIFVDVFD